MPHLYDLTGSLLYFYKSLTIFYCQQLRDNIPLSSNVSIVALLSFTEIVDTELQSYLLGLSG